MSLREDALTVAVLRALADRIRDASDTARDRMRAALSDAGADSASAELDGTRVAKVTLAGGKPVARVADDAAFTAWVQATHPTEVETRVRESYRTKVLTDTTKSGAPVDPLTGEIVPGVEITTGTAYVSTRFEKGGRDAVAQAWAAGVLADALRAAIEGTP
jgi:hypothetical protein